MDIRIGIINAPRELSFESDRPAEEITQTVSQALEGAASFLSLVDDKGNRYIVPTAHLGYVEVGSEETRRIGFVA